jgi:phosphoglycerate kinase
VLENNPAQLLPDNSTLIFWEDKVSDQKNTRNGLSFNKKTVRDIDVNGKRVLLRVDYNVPTNQDGSISDDSRIRASLPTIRYLLDHKAKIILCSHFGRPKGKIVESMRLAPAGIRLGEILQKPIQALKDCVGPEVEKAVFQMKEGEVVLLENLRFHPEEEANDAGFARSLAKLGEVYVDDAFGASHRAHASVTGVAAFLPAVAGFLMEKELTFMGNLLEKPTHPFIAVMGGAKVSDKIGVIENIFFKIDTLLIGGGMAANFLKAKGFNVGASVVEEDRLDYIREMFLKGRYKGLRFVLPVDVVVADKIEAGASNKVVEVKDIPSGWVIADIGPETINLFKKEIQSGNTIFWNGPMGVFEIEAFAQGTYAIAQAMADCKATTVVGGGSTAESVEEMKLSARMTHVSTGGGASLELLEGKELPGIAVLMSK